MDTLIEKLQNNISSRQKTDKPLIKYIFVALISFAILTAIIIWQVLYEQETISIEAPLTPFYILLFIISFLRYQKVNAFIIRKKEWYNNISEFTKEYSSYQEECSTFETLSKKEFSQIKSIPIKLYLAYCVFYLIMNALSDFLSVNYILEYMTISFIAFIIRLVFIDMPMNSIWNKLQMFESQFDYQLTLLWKKEQWISNDIDFIADPRKNRNFILWCFFSTITFGIMYIIWDYKIHTDPNNLYPQFHKIEDNIFSYAVQIANNRS